MEKIKPGRWPHYFAFWDKKSSLLKPSWFMKVSKKVSWVNFFWLATSFFLGRASLMGEVAPFALIFWALVQRFQSEKRYLVTIAILLGWLTSNALVFPPWFLPAAMISWKLLDLLSARIFKKKIAPFLSLPLTILLLRLPVLYSYHFPVYETSIVGLEIVLATIFPPLLQPFFAALKNEDLKNRLGPEMVVGALLLLAFVFLGMHELFLRDDLGVVNIVSPLVVLIGAYLWGPIWGMSAGIVIGLCLSFSAPSLFVYVGALGVSGLIAGLLSQYSRFWVAIGYFSVLRFLAYYSLEGGYILTSLWEDTIIIVIFLLVPGTVWQKLQGFDAYWPFKIGNEKKIRCHLGSRLKEFAVVFKELAVTFQPLNQAEEVRSKRDLAPLVNYFSRRVCRSCDHFKRCWQADLYNQYRRILSMLSTMEESKGEFSEKMIPVKLRRYCPRQGEIVKTIGNMKEIYLLNCHWQEKIRASRLFVSQQLDGISSVMHDLAQELNLNTGENLKENRTSRFHLEVGVAQVARDGYSVSGDSFAVLSLEGRKQALILSDGMGNGKEARMASISTVKLLEHLLTVGLRRDVVLDTINTLLRLRYPAERFATLDFALLDMQTGEIDLYKLGAAPSFFKNDEMTHIIGSESLPIGILDEIVPEKKSIDVSRGGTLVMVTDGVVDNPPGDEENWIVRALREIRHDHPQIIADRLIEEACYRWPRGVKDDLTVLVGQLRPMG